MDIIKVITQLRKEKQVSKKELSEVLGIDIRTYYRYEEGSPMPFDKALQAIEYFGYSISVTRLFE